jgi:hypothetical protein
MALIVRHFAKLSPAGREWVLARLAEDHERLNTVTPPREPVMTTHPAAAKVADVSGASGRMAR